MSERRRMRSCDWIYASINVAIGILFVLAAEGLAQLVTTEFWPLAVVAPILIAGLVLFEKVFKGLIDWEFPSKAQSPRKSASKGAPPILLLLSFPFGIAFGVILALLGLTDTAFW